MELNSKQKKYTRIADQLKELLSKDTNFIAQISTINAVLYHKFPNFFWVGFYLLNENRLIVGPYQGPVACQELDKNKGVCWQAINNTENILVDNVELFPGHIACDSRSKSEVALPLVNKNNNVVGVLDIDSDKLSNFDGDDLEGLKKILALLNFDFMPE